MKIKFALLTIITSLILSIGSTAAASTELSPRQEELAQRLPRRIEHWGPIGYGEWVSGELTPEVPAHLWEFEGGEGDIITIAMNALSDDLDPHVLLLLLDDAELDAPLSWSDSELEFLVEMTAEYGWLLIENDDREESINSLITSYRLPGNGRYYILATSCCTGGSSGPYELTVEQVVDEMQFATPQEQYPDDDTPYIPQTTQIIDVEIAANYLVEVVEDGETIVFSENIPGVIGRPFNKNDIVALEPTEMAPNGLLRRVVGISYSQGVIVLTTVQASLEEAIYNGTVHAEIILTQDGGYVTQSKPGMPLAKRVPVADVFPIPLFEEEIIPHVTVSGEIELEPSFEIEMVIEHSVLKRLFIKNTTRQSGELKLVAEAGFSQQAEIELTPLGDFAPIGIKVKDTDFKVWLTPEVTVYLGLEGSAKAAITTSVNQEIFYDVGLLYENDNLKPPVVDSHGGKIWAEPPDVTSGADAKAYLKPELALVVFGGTGPFIGAEGYLRFAADPCESPWWKLYGGVSGLVGAKLGVFSLDLWDDEWEIASKEWTLDEATDSSVIPCEADKEPPPNSDGNGLGWLMVITLVIAVAWYLNRKD